MSASIERHAAAGRAEQAVEVLDQGRLARAVLADDRDRSRPARTTRRHAAQRLDAARVAVDEVLDREPDARPSLGRRPGAAPPSAGPAPWRAPPARSLPRGPASASASAVLVERRSRIEPGRLGQPDERRRRQADRPEDGRCRARGPGGRRARPIRPASRTRQRSSPPRIAGSCSAQRIAVPLAGRARRGGRRPAPCPAGSSWAVGSSSTRSPVPIVTMLAIATRCCSPPDSANGSRSARCSMPRSGEDGVDPGVHLGRAARRGSRGRRRAPRGP